jgi:hypothetical protein
MKRLALAAMLIAAATVPAIAGTYTVTFKKMSLSGGGDIRSIKVWNAISQTQVPKNEGETFSIEVTLPEGECTARMAIFPSGGGRINARYEICSGRTLNLLVP